MILGFAFGSIYGSILGNKITSETIPTFVLLEILLIKGFLEINNVYAEISNIHTKKNGILFMKTDIIQNKSGGWTLKN